MSPKKNQEPSSGIERRKTRRRPVLETFSIFVVVPKKGFHRLQIHDLSDHGIGFTIDTEGEDVGDFPVKAGDILEIHLYLNQSLYLPLTVQIARSVNTDEMRRVGAEFNQKTSKSYEAFLSFLQMLDNVAEVAQIDNK